MEQYKNNKYVFSVPKPDVFVINNGEFFLIALIIILGFACLYFPVDTSLYILIGIIVTFMAGVIFAGIKYYSNAAYKIEIDFESQDIIFHMYRSNDKITKDFNMIENIREKYGNVRFKFQDKTLKYLEPEEINRLRECINKIKSSE